MFSDKAYYIEVLDYRWFEAAKSIGRDYKFITRNLAAVAVQTYIRRITQAITFVERVACVYSAVLSVTSILLFPKTLLRVKTVTII